MRESSAVKVPDLRESRRGHFSGVSKFAGRSIKRTLQPRKDRCPRETGRKWWDRDASVEPLRVA